MYDPNIPQQPAKTSRPWYKMKRTWAGAFVGLLVIGAIAGGSDDTKETTATPAPTKTVTATPSPTSADDAFKQLQKDNKKGQDDLKNRIAEASKSAEAKEEAASSDVPDVVGMNHYDAMALLHKKGFMVNEEDATGDRWIIDNTNWKVCRQEPGPGNHSATLRVAIYSVKLDESC
jgi:ABC-type glycerol-3-phosphate transport system substrate-binding protein